VSVAGVQYPREQELNWREAFFIYFIFIFILLLFFIFYFFNMADTMAKYVMAVTTVAGVFIGNYNLRVSYT
jgi:hypothetical protein